MQKSDKTKRTYIFIRLLAQIVFLSTAFEILIMFALDQLRNYNVNLTPWQEAVLDGALLAVVSTFSLWWLVVKPLNKKLDAEFQRNSEQSRINSELNSVLNKHCIVSATDLNGNITYANDKFYETLGYEQDELLGMHYQILANLDAESNDQTKSLVNTITQGEMWQGVKRLQHKTGDERWLETTMAPMLDQQGKPLKYISFYQDVTRIKQQERELQRFKLALESCGEMVLITDTHNLIEYANPAFLNFFGFTPDEIIGRSAQFFNNLPVNQALWPIIDAKLRQNKPWTGRLLGQRSVVPPPAPPVTASLAPNDPYYFWSDLHITPIIDAENKNSGFVHLMRDVSKQVAQENSLQQELRNNLARAAVSKALQQDHPLRDRLRQALTILSALKYLNLIDKGGFFLADADGGDLELYLPYNPLANGGPAEIPDSLAKLCNQAWSQNEFLVRDHCDCEQLASHPEHGHYIVPITSNGLTFGVMFLYTLPYTESDFIQREMCMRVAELISLALQQEKIKQELSHARDLALQTSQMKSTFLSNMSHEIRTPMNGVLGMLELLKDTGLSPSQHDLLHTAYNSAASLLLIINDILDFSKLEAGKIELEKINFNLRELLEEVIALLGESARNKNLYLTLRLDPQTPAACTGDPARLRQILINIIGNAIKFTEQGGVAVSVTISPEPPAMLNFEVRDTGIGISEAQQQRLFKAFAQADNSITRRFGGSGLGLSICKNLIELMGGQIGVSSQQNQGSCFWFNVPCKPADAGYQASSGPAFDALVSAAPILAPPRPAADYKDKRVLLVEDNKINQKVVLAMLHKLLLSPDLAENGEQALELLQEREYDLILMDCQMPGLDGIETTRIFRSLERQKNTRRVPIIALTAHATSEARDSCFAAGMDDFLSKPILREDLNSKIEYWIGKHTRQQTGVI